MNQEIEINGEVYDIEFDVDFKFIPGDDGDSVTPGTDSYIEILKIIPKGDFPKELEKEIISRFDEEAFSDRMLEDLECGWEDGNVY